MSYWEKEARRAAAEARDAGSGAGGPGGASGSSANASAGTEVSGAHRSPDTRTRLLDAAERLFAADGIAKTSLRAITQAAHANIAAVNYHFGSREGLIGEVFARRIAPINRERLELLDEVLERAAGAPPAIEAILNAFSLPALRQREAAPGAPGPVRRMGRAFTEPAPEVRGVIFSQFAQVFQRFVAALVLALPALPPSEVAARFRYAIGALVFTMMHPDLAGAPCAPGPDERARMVAFLAAGMRAPSAGSAEGGPA